jgi:crossover junction endodeoxyribonuclease RuvC
MMVIGLDLSLTAPGWFVRDAEGQATGGTWSPQGRGLDRMHSIVRKVLDLLPGDSKPLIIIEGFSFGSKGSALYEIGGLGYIVRYALWHRRLQVIEVPPTVVKKYATGKGNANKNIVIREVFKRWGVNVEDDNAADALVLGHIGMALAGIEEPTTEFQRAVITDLRKKMPAGAPNA